MKVPGMIAEMLLPSADIVIDWMYQIFISVLTSATSAIGYICILVYMLAVLAYTLEGTLDVQTKRTATQAIIISLMVYFLSNALLFLFI